MDGEREKKRVSDGVQNIYLRGAEAPVGWTDDLAEVVSIVMKCLWPVRRLEAMRLLTCQL